MLLRNNIDHLPSSPPKHHLTPVEIENVHTTLITPMDPMNVVEEDEKDGPQPQQ
jgi:hypothetical protein